MDATMVSNGLIVIGAAGFAGYLVWLIVRKINWDSKIPPVIGMLLCLVMMAGGVLTNPRCTELPVIGRLLQMVSSAVDGGGDGALEAGPYTLSNGVELSFSAQVPSEETGKWRLSTTSSSQPTADYAMVYYREMFSSDDEVHVVWNDALGTMTRLEAVGGELSADTYEYVDGEEGDANRMFTGTKLDARTFSTQTGEPLGAS